MTSMLPLLILVPAVAGLLCLLCVRSLARLGGPLLVLGTLGNLALAAVAATGAGLPAPLLTLLKSAAAPVDLLKGAAAPVALLVGPAEWQFALHLRLDAFATFIVLCAAGLAFLLAIYAAGFMRGRKGAGAFFGCYLFTIAFLQGAVLSDHLFTLLFFWEGMLFTLFAMIALGHVGAYKTAVKAFFINGVTDLCLMAGIGLVWVVAHDLSISGLAAKPLEVHGLGAVAFVLLFVGAISKAGAMPFHSWIPDAAVDAPLPFMALMPGAMEKLIGIYFTARISLDLFTGVGHSWAGTLMMIVGAVTILCAVLMALIQKDFKRLLSFHAISQVGYMILGIGTGTPVGIVGGLFHMVNNALYKSALFLTGGAVEQQAGTTNLKQISGLGRLMPVTLGCFLVAAFSISGFPLTNGFYSKELIYDGALHRGLIFYLAAALGSFFTAASFLKLGHAAFFGPVKAPKPRAEIKEASVAFLAPMGIIAALCLVFGVGNSLPIQHLIVPAVSKHLAGAEHLGGAIPHTWGLVLATIVTLVLATLNHIWGVVRTRSGLGAVDHIHYAPGAHQLYDAAERRWFDPYELALKLIGVVARLGHAVDRGVDYVYNKVVTGITTAAAAFLREAMSGGHAVSLVWLVVGATLILIYLAGGFF